MTDPIPLRVAERAATRYVENEHGCFISTYSVASHGYAQVGWHGPIGRYGTTAHRAAWVFHTGKQPEGTIDHTNHCDRRCVNPAHLRDIPNFDNARKNRKGAVTDLDKCVNGHNAPLVPRKQATRNKMTCIECERERQRRYRKRKRSAKMENAT